MADVGKIVFVDETEVPRLGYHRSTTDVRIFHRQSENGSLSFNIYSNGERIDNPKNKIKASQNLGFNRDQCIALRDYLNNILKD